MESESEGGQKFLPPNPLPFCPPELLDFKIRNSDFRQKMFELRSKNTANFFSKRKRKLFCGVLLLTSRTAGRDWPHFDFAKEKRNSPQTSFRHARANTKITKIVARQNELRTAIDEIVADIKGK
ncbi:hypothetical protein KKC56_01155 [Patescibacteria group bacterium]|nr:hypothetical protein [Patescibacteria group bacterium]MBU2415888.1 hypothetical protein [Patescibacteria group bacterium]